MGKVLQPVRTVEVVQENVVERIVECKKPIIQEQIVPVTRQVEQIIEVPKVQVVDEVQVQTVQRVVDVPVMTQVDQVIEVPKVQVVDRVEQVEVIRTVQRTVE